MVLHKKMKISLACLAIAICARLTFEALMAQTVEVPRVWATVYDNDHPKALAVQQLVTNPCYTNIVSEYKPIVKKLPYGRWEITFTSELTEALP